MEFHHGVPWNSVEFCLGLGHGVPRSFFFFHGIPWSSIEVFEFFFMEFYRVFPCALKNFTVSLEVFSQFSEPF